MKKMIWMCISFCILSSIGIDGVFASPLNLKLPFSPDYKWKVDSTYGVGLHINNSYYAIDFNEMGGGNSDCGMPALASEGGIVKFAGWNSDGFGNLVKIEHLVSDGSKHFTLYAHLNSIFVKVDQKIIQGHQVGTVGNTTNPGIAMDCHLHFELRKGDNTKELAEPMSGYSGFYTGMTNIISDNYGSTLSKSYPAFNPQTTPIYQWGDGTLAVVDQDRVAHGVLDTNDFLAFLSVRTCRSLAVIDFRSFNSNGVNVTNTTGANMYYNEIVRRGYIQSSGIFYKIEENVDAQAYIPLRGFYYRRNVENWIWEMMPLLPKMSDKDREYASAEIAVARLVLGIQQLTPQTCANQPPKITLLGANPMTLQKSAIFAEPGFMALDPESGNITPNVVVSGGAVNTAVPGTYVKKYDVTDSQGASATQMIRIIYVKDNATDDMSTPFITIGDINGNGYKELVVMVTDLATGKTVLKIRDINTGETITVINF